MYASHLGVEAGMAITMVAFSHSSPSLSSPNPPPRPSLCSTKTHYIFSTPPHASLHQFHCRLYSSVTPISISNSNSNSPPLIRASSSSSLSVIRDPMVPPYNVLITGSTKELHKWLILNGEFYDFTFTVETNKRIGYALAKEFLKAGDNVIICSRTTERVESALQDLRGEFGEQHVWGTKCDVRQGDDVKNLVAFAKEKLKYIDIWINNAGSNAYSYKPLSEASDEDLIEAIKMMLDQPRGGHIFNIDGAGSDGRPTPRAVTMDTCEIHIPGPICCIWGYKAQCGASDKIITEDAELRMDDVKNVIVHNLSPGMVTTDLLLSGASTKQVAEYLVPNIRSVPANGLSKPTYIRFLTGLKAFSQIFSEESIST
ncbi:unnamed protein product [Camellia sinensis]